MGWASALDLGDDSSSKWYIYTDLTATLLASLACIETTIVLLLALRLLPPLLLL